MMVLLTGTDEFDARPYFTRSGASVVKCRTALRALVQKYVRLLPTKADRPVLVGELDAELRRLRAAAAKPRTA
jgi:hypothetical protein